MALNVTITCGSVHPSVNKSTFVFMLPTVPITFIGVPMVIAPYLLFNLVNLIEFISILHSIYLLLSHIVLQLPHNYFPCDIF